ncbi:MAG: hypothetical protein J6A92_00565 [Lachnospiraceae bacterium]|nr:hypothetical protein [Lachnospiraceae bacterium]
MVEDAWKNFELSGKISDYLNYKQSMTADAKQIVQSQISPQENRGMGRYGTEHHSDRDDTKCNANWRV